MHWIVSSLLILSATLAQAPADTRPPCEVEVFSFLEGEWTVRVDELSGGIWKKSDARAWITRDAVSCTLVENFAGTTEGHSYIDRGYYGYDGDDNVLQLVWFHGQYGAYHLFVGQKEQGEIALDRGFTSHQAVYTARRAFLNITPDSFRCEVRYSYDHRKTWVVASRLQYTRVAPEPVTVLPSVELPPELARVLTDYEVAWEAKDNKALAALFTEDGFVLSGGQPPVRGRDGITKRYDGAGGPLALRALAWSSDGATAYIIGAYATKRDGEDVGKFTLTLKKQADGRWLIMSDMDNQNRRR